MNSHELIYILKLPVGYWKFKKKHMHTLILARNSTKKHNEKRSHHLTPCNGQFTSLNDPNDPSIIPRKLTTNLRNLSSLSEHKLEGRKPEKNSVTYFGHQMNELSPFQTSKIKPPGKEFSALIYSDLWRLWLCLPKVVLQSGSRSGFLVKGVKEQKTMRICLNQDENLGRWPLL